MKSYWTLAAALSLLIGACGGNEAQVHHDPQPAFSGIALRQGRAMVDSIYWYGGLRPDSLIARDGMLRVVLPHSAFGGRIHRGSHGCEIHFPPMGLIHTVAVRTWALRDSTIHRDTVQVVLPGAADTTRSGMSTSTCSLGRLVFPIPVADTIG